MSYRDIIMLYVGAMGLAEVTFDNGEQEKGSYYGCTNLIKLVDVRRNTILFMFANSRIVNKYFSIVRKWGIYLCYQFH